MNDDVLNIGEKLRTARQKQKLSLRELAARADVSPSLLSQIENGRANPSVMTLYNVAGALEVPITFFFPGSDGVGMWSQQAASVRSNKTPSEMRSNDRGEFDGTVKVSETPVMRPELRKAIELMGGVRWERLTPKEEQDIQFLEIYYQPGASSGPAMSRHGGREFGLVLNGELKLELGFEHYTLVAGDSIVFDSTTPHRLSNECSETLRAIWVIMNRNSS